MVQEVSIVNLRECSLGLFLELRRGAKHFRLITMFHISGDFTSKFGVASSWNTFHQALVSWSTAALQIVLWRFEVVWHIGSFNVFMSKATSLTLIIVTQVVVLFILILSQCTVKGSILMIVGS